MSTFNANANVETEGKLDTEKVKHTVREGLETARHKVADGYEAVSEKAHEVWDKAADKSINDVVGSGQDYVRDHPGQCVMIAAGAGLVAGYLLRSRRG